jgi:1-acyl-sn-glycerol-3-phosphate acyltransferase
MATDAIPPKPVTDLWRPYLTRLPSLNLPRRLLRGFLHYLARFILALLTHTTMSGLEHLPARGPALLAVNHLGDADAAILLAALPTGPEALAKLELFDFPVLGRLMDWYGCIWLHRGRPDRRALRCALDALEDGRLVVVAPEGRYTLANGLEPGGKGAAYLAVSAGVPVIPLAITGTQNEYVYASLRHFCRPKLSLTIGEPILLGHGKVNRQALEADTQRIMHALAALLPPEYRGAYS